MILNSSRVFVVEDEVLISMEIQDRLIRLGYEICGSATHGESAIRQIEDSAPDLVLVDIHLADPVDGIAVVAELSARIDVPFVFLTAFCDEELIRRTSAVKAAGYLTKPFTELELHAVIQVARFGTPDSVANTAYLRPVIVTGRQIIRATLPISTVPASQGQYRSGLGDFNVFDAIKLTQEGAKTDLAVGPLLVVPTATNSSLGQGKWQAGAAFVGIHPMQGGSLLGGLITWQHSFAGDKDRPTAHVATMQPIAIFGIGGGYYVRSTGISVFDFATNRYLVPLGLGVGKVFKAGNAIANAFIEPQFSVYHKGSGQPAMQLFVGLNFQWARK